MHNTMRHAVTLHRVIEPKYYIHMQLPDWNDFFDQQWKELRPSARCVENMIVFSNV